MENDIFGFMSNSVRSRHTRIIVIIISTTVETSVIVIFKV